MNYGFMIAVRNDQTYMFYVFKVAWFLHGGFGFGFFCFSAQDLHIKMLHLIKLMQDKISSQFQ